MTDYSRFYFIGDNVIGLELYCLDCDGPQDRLEWIDSDSSAPHLDEALRTADLHWIDHHAPDPTGMTCGMRCLEGHTYERGNCALAESANELVNDAADELERAIVGDPEKVPKMRGWKSVSESIEAAREVPNEPEERSE